MKTQTLLVGVGLALVAYVIYRNYLAPNAGANANASMGGADFGVLDPNNW